MNNRGQTLIEVVTSLGLIMIVVAALVGLGVVALKTSSSSRNRTVAAKLAGEGMEMARSVRDQGSLDDVNATNLPNDSATVGGDVFTRTWTITGDSSKKTVVVGVSWPESGGTKSVQISGFLTDWR
jgi:Tfp pilus assembly protein PilV